MFSNKENVNILTSLMVEHGIRHVVVCPGSRNAPLIHNFNECEAISCHPVTDERSAGFYALGMAQATGLPVAVCVTSGTALLNVAPAVAEAYYQKIPLVVISADRPEAFINQLDGQTMPQSGALGCFAVKSVSIPEPCNEAERWRCNRVVNEALLECMRHGGIPVHVNVPLSEPLFVFTEASLPSERKITAIPSATNCSILKETLLPAFAKARRPMVVIGQVKHGEIDRNSMRKLSHHAVILSESTGYMLDVIHFDEVLSSMEDTSPYMPDFVLYIGGTLVSKRLRQFLRGATDADVWRIDEDGGIHDTFMNLRTVVHGKAKDAVEVLAEGVNTEKNSCFVNLWNIELERASRHAAGFEPAYSQMAAVKYFEEQLEDIGHCCHVHYANSSAIRLANIYSAHHVYCNRGVNGIEGSLSVAAGHSVVCQETVFCIIGDLSFFYDQNALWNVNLRGNLRIILLNNGCGGIFHRLDGLSESRSLDTLVAAGHSACAQGICTQNDIVYMKATSMDEMRTGMAALITSSSHRPMLLEVFTDKEEDKKALSLYYRQTGKEDKA